MTNILKQNQKKILGLLLDMGEALLSSGSEINRVEETLCRMAEAYGAVDANVFVITSSIVLTISFVDGSTVTQTRRITSSGGNDFLKLERLNGLSRRCCTVPIPIDELSLELEKITQRKPSKLKKYLGSALAAGAFAVFFGGQIDEGIAAAIFGLIICFMQIKVAKFCPNNVFFYFICAFVTGLGICLLGSQGSILNIDKIMIGDIMLLIPGIAITSAVRDMLIGETISGAMKLVECLVWAATLAAGFMLAMYLTGGLI